MPEYLAPGVYVEEVPSGNMPIQAASTSTAGMVGCAARGPVGVPTLVTSMGGYARIFGGRLDPLTFSDGRDALPYAAEGFFANGGARLYVVRVAGAGALESTYEIGTQSSAAVDGAAVGGGTDVVLTSVDGLVAGMMLTLGSLQRTIDAVDLATRTITLDAALPNVLAGVTVDGDQAAGGADLVVSATAGIVVDMQLVIGGNVHRVTAVDAATNTLTLDPVLAAAVTDGDDVGGLGLADGTLCSFATRRGIDVAANAAIGDAEVELASLDGLRVGQELLIGGTVHAITAIDPEDDTVTLDPVLAIALNAGDEISAPGTVIRVHARWPGVWGDRLQVSLAAKPILSTTLAEAATAGDLQVRLAAAFGLFPGSVIAIGTERAEVEAVDTNTGIVTLTGALAANAIQGTAVVSQEFGLTVERLEGGKVVESESFDKLSLASEHPRYMGKIVGTWDAAAGRPSLSGGSGLIRLEDLADETTRVMPLAVVLGESLSGGDDDVTGITADAIIGTRSEDPNVRSGIQALMNEATISLVAVPGMTGAAGAGDVAIQNALVEHCEAMRYRFAVLEVPLGSTLAQARGHRQNFDSTRAAVYYPGLVIPDSFGNPGDRRVIPSSGHMLGVIARTDITRGVHKAPANEVVRGILGFETKLTKGEQDILNPLNLNCYRDFREENRGLRIYGGRVATSNPEFRYVNVRRLMLFIEQSLDTGLQWAVFEPNSEPTWATVKQSITGFLTSVWRNGALEGVVAEEAFFVNIGYDLTMTQDDIDNGRMIVEIGVAPVKPAEFVILRISQKTREATA
jgi:uncharacterized protein